MLMAAVMPVANVGSAFSLQSLTELVSRALWINLAFCFSQCGCLAVSEASFMDVLEFLIIYIYNCILMQVFILVKLIVWNLRKSCMALASRDHFVHVSCQWETTWHCNVVSHWLGAYAKWSLHMHDMHGFLVVRSPWWSLLGIHISRN